METRYRFDAFMARCVAVRPHNIQANANVIRALNVDGLAFLQDNPYDEIDRLRERLGAATSAARKAEAALDAATKASNTPTLTTTRTRKRRKPAHDDSKEGQARPA